MGYIDIAIVAAPRVVPTLNGMITVITGAGERTQDLAVKLAQKQCDEVHLLNISPQPDAVKKAYQIAINSKRKWLIILGADMLLTDNALHELKKGIENTNLFSVYGHIDCKFMGKRPACPRIYRISDLPFALKNFQTLMRPEALLCQKMERQGKGQKAIDFITAKHDYEQYYTDIYRKGYAHAVKHRNEIDLNYWREMSVNDQDYKVALRGFVDGIKHNGNMLIDIRKWNKAEILKKLQITEKPAL